MLEGGFSTSFDCVCVCVCESACGCVCTDINCNVSGVRRQCLSAPALHKLLHDSCANLPRVASFHGGLLKRPEVSTAIN